MDGSDGAGGAVAERQTTGTRASILLSSAPLSRRFRIVRIDLDGEAAGWLEAVGLHPGEELQVLRCAAFGGPVHVRTESGGEFAVGREIAACMALDEVA